ncbi:thiosulfate oxidation carrier protein SoxY [Polynucleobacter paneuropaeus]|jgi:sulfur-oxidizing protein SoxY|uniref:Thiosulfate oxidation carrier protein SoxY n=1 Tax=Polynucleobacter paneuropaeus TaxID=2527775 RepID=A0A9Q7CPT3_9BURK|nr:thiosulfate oxidation carrier protein SoxY [Polynucleobacter paneuropaeus]MBT8518351.1 thiosulfate oxidation carrier protein SoxY [Polynucleobacter paneuropaeus]MBT8531370.1 thiosulfate oxidation carrier protein SoxY [Polynucleobacter paneuropaeus]MBT8550753.1 thiosulfate oxidation carrier protein SoxY [Polynucleobacter paneuropaeus]MBT8579043.1 thiosulfate oxidation carrier protein SoxY [Polynucleobacter paneuropaeus]MBT8584049.1 thiosulfate oxidation carrier protein SoxY [Polynucleobacter
MNKQRRDLLKYSAVFGLMASAGLISTAQAEEWNKAAFEGKSLDDVFKALGTSTPDKSSAVTLNAPDIAENGAVVPVSVTSTLKADQIAILVEKNPSTLAAQFFLPAGTEAFVTTRIKMGQTSNVYALVKADGKWAMAVKEIKVTLGGCGG